MRNSFSGVIATQFDFEPTSPARYHKVKGCFVVLKVLQRDSESFAKQVLANMMVVAAMSVEKACWTDDTTKLCELKYVSLYGLS